MKARGGFFLPRFIIHTSYFILGLIAAFGADEVAGPGGEGGEGDPVLLVRLLHAGGLEILQDHLGEGLLSAVLGGVFLQGVNQFIVFIHAQHAVGAEALDSERAGHADLFLVVVGLVVEIFKLSFGGDGLVNFLLPGDAGGPPFF